MKYAFMSFSTPELTLAENLALAKQLGYAGIEPRIEAKHRHGIELDATPAQRAEAKKQAEDSGIALCCLATSRRYADPAIAQENVDLTRRCIDLAADVGAPRLRVFGGPLPKEFARTDAIKLVADSLLAVADFAQQRGVYVCMETHDDWCDPAHVAEVMNRVNHPAIAVNWDIMHPVRRAGKTIEESFRALQPWIRHCHIHDGVTNEKGGLDLVWTGTGVVDHRKAIEVLSASGWDGYLSGEWINRVPGYAEHLPRELEILKGYERELGIA